MEYVGLFVHLMDYTLFKPCQDQMFPKNILYLHLNVSAHCFSQAFFWDEKLISCLESQLQLIYLEFLCFCCVFLSLSLVVLVHSVCPKFYWDAKLSTWCKSITIDLSGHVAIFPTNDPEFSGRHIDLLLKF